MRVVTVEEHFTVPSLVERVSGAAIEERGYFSAKHLYGAADPGKKFADLGTDRIEAMEKASVTVQVLSYEGPAATHSPRPRSPSRQSACSALACYASVARSTCACAAASICRCQRSHSRQSASRK